MNDKESNMPGTCVACGNDAYIRMGTSGEMVCAHCFPGLDKTGKTAPPPPEKIQPQVATGR
jgi:hypothetical protein